MFICCLIGVKVSEVAVGECVDLSQGFAFSL